MKSHARVWGMMCGYLLEACILGASSAQQSAQTEGSSSASGSGAAAGAGGVAGGSTGPVAAGSNTPENDGRPTGPAPAEEGNPELPPPTTPSSGNPACTLPSFPGAEGFGACASGGRGGQVVYVTNLNASGQGSLQNALDVEGARYILFKVSGVIDSSVTVRGHGNVTLAGQTSPGGVVVKGILIENTYDRNEANNVIIRHLRSRQGKMGDGMRIAGANDVIVDHCSFESSDDEQIEISRSHNVTVQRSILGEHNGDHEFSGMLINYSKTLLPLDNLSIHHNAWIRVMGRYPEITCEENDDGFSGSGVSNCRGVVRHFEVSNNVMFDPMRDGIVFNTCTRGGNDCAPFTAQNSWGVHLNFIGNLMRVRSSQNRVEEMFGEGRAAWAQGTSQVHFTANRFEKGTTIDESAGPAGVSVTRFSYPTIGYTPTGDLIANIQADCGAQPSDPMDRRLLGYLDDNLNSGYQSFPAVGVLTDSDSDGTPDAYEFDWTQSPAAPVDSDNDGMPDVFETSHGLDPNVADHNATTLSPAGYTNLEVYLNALSDAAGAR